MFQGDLSLISFPNKKECSQEEKKETHRLLPSFGITEVANMVTSTGIPHQRTWASFYPSNLSYQGRLGSSKNLSIVPDRATDPKKTQRGELCAFIFVNKSIHRYINSLSFKHPKLPLVLKGRERKIPSCAAAQNSNRTLN